MYYAVAHIVICLVTDRHALLSASVRNSHMKCMFLVVYPQIWRELFSPLHALNFGIAGDTTCNVLWRLQNGELENIRPKVRQASYDPERKDGLGQNHFIHLSHTCTLQQIKNLAYTFYFCYSHNKNVHTLLYLSDTQRPCTYTVHACSCAWPPHLLGWSRSRWHDGPWLSERRVCPEQLLWPQQPCY